jgi:hypothetical protein
MITFDVEVDAPAPIVIGVPPALSTKMLLFSTIGFPIIETVVPLHLIAEVGVEPVPPAPINADVGVMRTPVVVPLQTDSVKF